MNKNLEIWEFAAEKLKQNESAVLLVVAESSGSSPGRQGFKMIVSRDEIWGSIGGGMMEMKLVEIAKRQVKNAKLENKSTFQTLGSKIIPQIHLKNSPDSSGMICSGRQTVILFVLNFSHLETVQKIIEALENHRPKSLRISNEKFAIFDRSKADFSFEQAQKNEFLYTENLGCKNKIYIIGGGHCALALSELMSKMDFHISLFDDREDLNTLTKNQFVDEKILIESYERIGEFIEGGENVFVVVMTVGYKFDEIVIRKLFGKDFKYFGVLGSKAKMKTLIKSLEKKDFNKEKLRQIKTPIGLKINSRTPEEIAVSIAAEIISVKNAGRSLY